MLHTYFNLYSVSAVTHFLCCLNYIHTNTYVHSMHTYIRTYIPCHAPLLHSCIRLLLRVLMLNLFHFLVTVCSSAKSDSSLPLPLPLPLFLSLFAGVRTKLMVLRRNSIPFMPVFQPSDLPSRPSTSRHPPIHLALVSCAHQCTSPRWITDSTAFPLQRALHLTSPKATPKNFILG